MPEYKNNLREVRTDHLMTQEKLSELSGISKTTISFIENGHVTPTEITRKKLAKALNEPVDKIFPD